MSETMLVSLGLVLALWCLWFVFFIDTATTEKDVLCSTLVGVARGTHHVEIDGSKVTVKTRGL